MWNNISGGDCSVALALLNPDVPCVFVVTGGANPLALRNINQLQQKGHTVIALSSMQGGYNTYFDYLWKCNKIPFYNGCCYRGKDWHLDRFYNIIPGPVTVNIGFIQGEDHRARRLAEKNTDKRKFNFPMLTFTREQCEKVIKAHDMKPIGYQTGCWFCPKGDNPPEWAIKGIISPEGQAERAKLRALYDKRGESPELVNNSIPSTQKGTG